MLSPIELTLLIGLVIGLSWWWRAHGQREYALTFIKTHCQKLNLTLLDGYVALKKVTLQKDTNGKLRLAKVYSFEFTVTQEQRYTGYITLYGYYVGRIELPPYPINDTETEVFHRDNIAADKPDKPIITLDDYRERKNGHK